MTHKELFEALLAGKKVSKDGKNYEFLINGYLVHSNGHRLTLPNDTTFYNVYEERSYQVLFSYVNRFGKTIYDTTIDEFKSQEDFLDSKHSNGRTFVKLLT